MIFENEFNFFRPWENNQTNYDKGESGLKGGGGGWYSSVAPLTLHLALKQ